MPIYEYRCQKCGNEVEVMQKLNDPAPSPCAKCAAEQSMERLMSRSSFHLKGGGWYSDLYGSTKKDGTSGGTSSASSTPASSSTTTTSTAPAAAPAAAPSTSSSGSGGSGGSTT